jgi:hypothetical protein
MARTKRTVESYPMATDRLNELVQQLDNLMALKVEIENELAGIGIMINDFATNILPEAMPPDYEAGFRVPWADGVITIDTSCHGSITKANREAAYRWLRDHGYDDLIKCRVSVDFGLRESLVAAKWIAHVKKSLPEREVEVAETVPGSTLKKFVTLMLDEGEDWPADLFGAYRKETVKLPWRISDNGTSAADETA